MQETLKKLFVKLLRETANKIESNNCELSDQEMTDIMGIMSHRVLSKEQACSYLNLSRSRFDDLVREGRIPKGRKRRGFKELIWFEDELNNCVNLNH